jgi:hypothetical protein
MARAAFRVVTYSLFSTLLALLTFPVVSVSPANAQTDGVVLAYHQLTELPEEAGSVGFPIISADGRMAVFSDAPGTGDAETPNRIYLIDVEGGAISEVDAYQPLCYCGAMVDIDADGSTVVSSDSVQVRVADPGGARELVSLSSNEITGVVIDGDGETIYFIVRRDAASKDGLKSIPRGIWAIDADGENLRQIVGSDAVAEAAGVPVEATGCCFHADGHPLDVSERGDHIIFGAFAGEGEHVFLVDGDSSDLRILRDSVSSVLRVAVSGDGTTAAFDVLPLGTDVNEVAVAEVAGGTPRVLDGVPGGGYDEPFQITYDGSQLLSSPNGLLIETDSGEIHLMAASVPGAGGNHEAVLTDGLPRGTMDGEGDHFLYVMRSIVCADCANRQEQLALLEVDPAALGEAPEILDGRIEPDSIEAEYGSEAMVTASIETANRVIGVGFAALLGGIVDVNVGHGRVLHDDGLEGDAAPNDDVYTVAGIVHGPVVAREADSGPRIIRISAEVMAGDGRLHATAVDIGTLTVE